MTNYDELLPYLIMTDLFWIPLPVYSKARPAYSDVDLNVYFAFHVIFWWVVFQLLFIKYTWYLSRFKWSFQWLFINGDLLSKSLLALYIAAIGPGVGGNLPQHAVCYHKQELHLYRPNCPVHFVCLFVVWVCASLSLRDQQFFMKCIQML